MSKPVNWSLQLSENLLWVDPLTGVFPMSFSDLINKVEGLLSGRSDLVAANTALSAQVASLQAEVAKYAGAPSNDDVDALNAKIDNTLNPPAPAPVEAEPVAEPAAQ